MHLLAVHTIVWFDSGVGATVPQTALTARTERCSYVASSSLFVVLWRWRGCAACVQLQAARSMRQSRVPSGRLIFFNTRC